MHAGGESLLSCPLVQEITSGLFGSRRCCLDVQVEKHVTLISNLVGELMLCTKRQTARLELLPSACWMR